MSRIRDPKNFRKMGGGDGVGGPPIIWGWRYGRVGDMGVFGF